MQKDLLQNFSFCNRSLRYVQLFFHDFNHHSGSQFEAIPEDQTVGYRLILSHTIRVLLKQLLLLIRHGGTELFFVSADQLLQFLVLLTGNCVCPSDSYARSDEKQNLIRQRLLPPSHTISYSRNFSVLQIGFSRQILVSQLLEAVHVLRGV